MQEQPTNAAITLQQKLQPYLQDAAKTLHRICNHTGISKEAEAAIMQDAVDIMRGDYSGIHATPQQMEELTAKTVLDMWESIANADIPVFAFVFHFYAACLKQDTEAAKNPLAKAIAASEDSRQRGEEAEPNKTTSARWVYCTLATLFNAEFCNANEEELTYIITSAGFTKIAKRANLIATALDMRKQKEEIEATAARERQERRAKNRKRKQNQAATNGLKEDLTPLTMPVCAESSSNNVISITATQKKKRTRKQKEVPHAIAVVQPITLAIGDGLQTSDIADGTQVGTRPLRQAVMEMQERAELIANDVYATQQQKEDARNFITNVTNVMHALDGLQIIPQALQPKYSNEEYSGYDITPYRLAQIAAGNDYPNTEIITGLLRAMAFLSTQRIRIFEEVWQPVKAKDKDGNIKKDESGKAVMEVKPVKVVHDFNPVSVHFRTRLDEETTLTEATKVHLGINNVLLEGCSGKYKTIIDEAGRKQKYRIRTPIKHLTTTQQIYALNNDEETIFRNLVLSKAHALEEDILAVVFDYEARQAAALKEAQEAAAHVAEVAAMVADGLATEEERKAAEQDAIKKHQRAKTIIVKHKGRDVKKLQKMFETAVKTGLLQSYKRSETAESEKLKQYGCNTATQRKSKFEQYKWAWTRPKAEQAQEEQTPKQN